MNTVNKNEVNKFSIIASEWWNPEGKFKPLHQFNPVRLAYIKDKIKNHFDNSYETIDLLDIGCGGGLLCEPMARLGLNVTGIDASEKNIAVATNHAEEMKLKINYKCTTVEDLTKEEKRFDIILNMEVVEHVDNVPLFLQSTADLLNPEGILMIATLNRTLKSFAFAIVGAEYILRWLPKGTHDWNKFLKPQEIQSHLSNLELLETTGVSYNPLKALWSLSDDMNVNYMMCFKKLS